MTRLPVAKMLPQSAAHISPAPRSIGITYRRIGFSSFLLLYPLPPPLPPPQVLLLNRTRDSVAKIPLNLNGADCQRLKRTC